MLNLGEYHKLLELKPKMVAFTHMSNVLGTITPAGEIIALAHQAGAVPWWMAPNRCRTSRLTSRRSTSISWPSRLTRCADRAGLALLYGKTALLEAMPPFLGGGDMIKRVALRSFAPNSLPHKFEAGTPAIAEAVGFGAAVDYLARWVWRRLPPTSTMSSATPAAIAGHPGDKCIWSVCAI